MANGGFRSNVNRINKYILHKCFPLISSHRTVVVFLLLIYSLNNINRQSTDKNKTKRMKRKRERERERKAAAAVAAFVTDF